MIAFYYKDTLTLNTPRAKKDCQYKIQAVEKKIAQVRSHISHILSMIESYHEGMSNDPYFINCNLYGAQEINRLTKIKKDYENLLDVNNKNLIKLKKRMEIIESRMKELNIKDERVLEMRDLDHMVELSIMKKNDA